MPNYQEISDEAIGDFATASAPGDGTAYGTLGSAATAGRVIRNKTKWRAYLTVAILALINTLNYMDRFTIPSVLSQVTDTFRLTSAQGGLLQTVFICSYMVFAPLFGYLGDRYNRKWIIVVGVTIWSVITFSSSFVPPDAFWLFLLTRGLVGIGESSYITVSPAIVGDLFTGDQRFLMLTAIFITVPIGSGLGFLVGAQLASTFGDWRYALRFTPFVALLCVFLMAIFVHEPVRGAAEREEQAAAIAAQRTNDTADGSERSVEAAGREEEEESVEFVARTNWLADILAIVRVRTFVLNSLGFTAVCFVAGALSWWAPTYLSDAFMLPTASTVLPADSKSVSFAFGVLTCVAGFVGVGSGLLTARLCRPRYGMQSDPLICAVGLLLAAPAVYFAVVTAPFSDLTVYALTFFGEASLCISWALNTDIVLRVIVPSRRSTANAFGMLFSHLFGDALCPLLIGAFADLLVVRICADQGIAGCLAEDSTSIPVAVRTTALMYALFINAFVCAVGGCAYLFCSLTIVRDANSKDEQVAAEERLLRERRLARQLNVSKSRIVLLSPYCFFLRSFGSFEYI